MTQRVTGSVKYTSTFTYNFNRGENSTLKDLQMESYVQNGQAKIVPEQNSRFKSDSCGGPRHTSHIQCTCTQYTQCTHRVLSTCHTWVVVVRRAQLQYTNTRSEAYNVHASRYIVQSSESATEGLQITKFRQ